MKKVFGYLLLLGFLSIGCTTEKEQKQDSVYSFKEYIFNTTKGVVSKKSTINIVLAKEIVGKEIGAVLNKEVFEITPKIKGTLKLQGLKSIVFEPSEDLVPNTNYSVTVNLDKLFVDIPADKKQFNFGFKR